MLLYNYSQPDLEFFIHAGEGRGQFNLDLASLSLVLILLSFLNKQAMTIKNKRMLIIVLVTNCLVYIMPSIMNPTVPRTNGNIVGRVWTTDPYLSEAAVKARLLAYQPQLNIKK